jgi:hypothetical protein
LCLLWGKKPSPVHRRPRTRVKAGFVSRLGRYPGRWNRHPRASGNPGQPQSLLALDPGFRGVTDLGGYSSRIRPRAARLRGPRRSGRCKSLSASGQDRCRRTASSKTADAAAPPACRRSGICGRSRGSASRDWRRWISPCPRYRFTAPRCQKARPSLDRSRPRSCGRAAVPASAARQRQGRAAPSRWLG